MLLLLAIFCATTSAHNLTCHCLNGTVCHANGYCDLGCEKGWFGPGCQVGNVALGKAANQSSTYYADSDNYTFSAGLAIDGVMPGSYARYCSHTAPLTGSDESSWWSVVLDTAQYHLITNITIVNRIGGTQQRLTNFQILYSNETEGNPDPSSSIWHKCAEENGSVGSRKTYTCQNTAIARRVAVYLMPEATRNPEAILTLCEVLIYGYQKFVCPSGYTGPGCLLRSCDHCDSNIGQCSENFGSCSYFVCPQRSLLPPECWITLSDYTGVDIRTAATCYKLQYSIKLPETQPNIAASLLQLQVSTSDGQVVVNETIPVQGVNSTTFMYNNTSAYASYEVSVKPLYCDITNMACFYAASSNVSKVSMGKREYILSHDGSCVNVNVTSATPDCEPPTHVQLTCQDKAVDGVSVNSTSFNVCGLKKYQGYNCFITAVVNSDIIERHSVYIVMGLLSSSRAPENDSCVLAGSIGGSIAVIVVIVAIVAFVYCRRQRCTRTPGQVVSQYENVNSCLPDGILDHKKLPPSFQEQGNNSYESLQMESGLQATTTDYAILKT